VFFVGVNAGGDQKNESDKKTDVDVDLAFYACGGNPAGIVLGSRYYFVNLSVEVNPLIFPLSIALEGKR